MITKITGTLNRVLDEEIRLQVGPFEYQVLVPEFVRRQIQTRGGQELTLHVMEYLEANQMSSRMIPRRVGFLHEVELEFFDLFCTVDKIGVKKALKALGRPIKEIADAIHRQDTKWLTTLPGIGKTSAEQIVATLRTKVTKFALMGAPLVATEADGKAATAVDTAIYDDAYAGLLALGMSPMDARSRIDQVIRSGKECKTPVDIINAVFKREE
jgi:Holliday junction DNA helicase RuvA